MGYLGPVGPLPTETFQSERASSGREEGARDRGTRGDFTVGDESAEEKEREKWERSKRDEGSSGRFDVERKRKKSIEQETGRQRRYAPRDKELSLRSDGGATYQREKKANRG